MQMRGFNSKLLIPRALEKLQRLMKAGAIEKVIQLCRQQRLMLPMELAYRLRNITQLIELCRRITFAQ